MQVFEGFLSGAEHSANRHILFIQSRKSPSVFPKNRNRTLVVGRLSSFFLKKKTICPHKDNIILRTEQIISNSIQSSVNKTFAKAVCKHQDRSRSFNLQ